MVVPHHRVFIVRVVRRFPFCPSPCEIPEALQGILGRPQKISIGNDPRVTRALEAEVSKAEQSEQTKPKEVTDLLAEALQPAFKKRDDDKPKAKEPETVKEPDFPNRDIQKLEESLPPYP